MTPRKSWLFSMAGGGSRWRSAALPARCGRRRHGCSPPRRDGRADSCPGSPAARDCQLAERSSGTMLLTSIPRHREAALGTASAPFAVPCGARHNAVDRFKTCADHGCSPAPRAHSARNVTGMVAFQFFIQRASRSKGMVAVADGEHHGNALQALVLLLPNIWVIVRRSTQRLPRRRRASRGCGRRPP